MNFQRTLRVGIATDGLEERTVDGEVRIANGGVGVYIYELIRHLLELDGPQQFYLIRYGVGQLDIYRHPRANPVFLPALGPKVFRIALDYSHTKLARRLNLDLFHYPNQFGGFFLGRSIRRVATLHDLTPLLFAGSHPLRRVIAYKLLARPSLRRADHIIAVSNSTRADLIKFGIRAEQIVTVYPGVSTSFSPGDISPTFSARRDLPCPYMLAVGVLEPRKNHRMLLEALETINRAGHRLGLVVIGRRGWRWTDPLSESRFASLRPSVRVLEDVSEAELVEFYRHAAVCAYPSLYEGFGLPVLEAMACGTPVVCSNASSLPEVGGEAALYADPNESGEFAAQVVRVLLDLELRKSMIARGLDRARRFSWVQTAQATLDLYRSVCDDMALNSTEAVGAVPQ